jgi:cytochrome c peroxidase
MNVRTRCILVICFFTICVTNCARKKNEAQTETGSYSKATIGRYLFFDTRLSFNNTKSCSSCHDPQFAFTDGYRRSTTATGASALHNAPSLINCASLKHFDWADPRITSLEQQHQRPLFNTEPVEMGAKGYEEVILKRIESDTLYRALFKKNFSESGATINFRNITICLAEFVKNLQSRQSAYDRYRKGDADAMSRSAQRGMQLFFSDKLNCASCHATDEFTLAAEESAPDSIYLNIGLYNVGNKNIYPPGDIGLAAVTHDVRDNGKFRIPSLRNAALTAPYFHDGSVASLDEVIDIYAAGGREIDYGPNAGQGARNKNKDRRIKGFRISREEKSQLIDFFYALSDSTIAGNSNFSNPFKKHKN